jgi:hypothetical protein
MKPAGPEDKEGAVAYYTRVLSKDEEFPSFEELAQLIRAEHPEFKLTRRRNEEEWDTLLLSETMRSKLR